MPAVGQDTSSVACVSPPPGRRSEVLNFATVSERLSLACPARIGDSGWRRRLLDRDAHRIPFRRHRRPPMRYNRYPSRSDFARLRSRHGKAGHVLFGGEPGQALRRDGHSSIGLATAAGSADSTASSKAGRAQGTAMELSLSNLAARPRKPDLSKTLPPCKETAGAEASDGLALPRRKKYAVGRADCCLPAYLGAVACICPFFPETHQP